MLTHHLPPNLEKGLTEINRILKPGGYFCFWEPSAKSLLDLLRSIWYRFDPDFFEDNEKSIDVPSIKQVLGNEFEIINTIYGGNLAYLFVNCSMAFRIPQRFVRMYSPSLMRFEKMLHPLLHKSLSSWVLCLMKKRE